jgi:hypothetical protein
MRHRLVVITVALLDWLSRSRVKARGRSGSTFWVWAGVVAFALGAQALPGFAQSEEEEPAQARPRPEREVRGEEPGAPPRGARPPSPETNPIPLPEPAEPAVGQRPPSPENNPIPMP